MKQSGQLGRRLVRSNLISNLCSSALVIVLVGCNTKSDDAVTQTDAASQGSHDRHAREAVAPETVKTSTRILFHEAADEMGVRFEREDDMRGLKRIVESTGGGVAAFDFDNDGRIDLFFTDGCKLPLVVSDQNRSNRLYRAAANMKYEEATESASLKQHGYFHGCAVGDFNSDGFDDLYVTAFGPNFLYRNNGDGTFTDQTMQTGTEAEAWGSSAAFADLNGDSHLDLYLCNYLQAYEDPIRICRSTASPDGIVTCPPHVFAAEEDRLYVSRGDGSFREGNEDFGLIGEDGNGLGVVIFDYNRDGWPDIYIANDGTPNFLYVNETGTADNPDTSGAGFVQPMFQESAALLGAAVNQAGESEAGMGIAAADYDENGYVDLFLTHYHLQTNTMYANAEGNYFEDKTQETGLGPPSRQMLGFGTVPIDFDNDGWQDLFIANGHIADLRWRPTSPDYQMRPQLFKNAFGKFTEVLDAGSYFDEKHLGRGVALADVDNDGHQDLVISHQRAASEILINTANSGHKSVTLTLVGTKSNRNAFNSAVTAKIGDRKLLREIVGGGSYQSASDRRIHFGMGDADGIDSLNIQWQSGNISRFESIGPGHYLIVEGWPELRRL